jgi:hypothetical protein
VPDLDKELVVGELVIVVLESLLEMGYMSVARREDDLGGSMAYGTARSGCA